MAQEEEEGEDSSEEEKEYKILWAPKVRVKKLTD